MGVHVFPILNPPPTSLPVPSLWVIPVHQPQASCILHWTWTGNSFQIRYYICFNAILPNHPTLALSHRVQKTVLYICVSLLSSIQGYCYHLSKFHIYALVYQSILKEIRPGISLEGMMLKLKLQYFGHLLQRVDSLEKTLMLGGIGGRRRRGW